jgi:putative flavoprotein involved in K+ transport
MAERVDAVVVGGGQAGLSASHELTELGIEHVVLERGRIGQTWRDRWDSFCLVTPNWSVRLPGAPYEGGDPAGYLPRDEIVAYLEGYAGSFGAPVREAVEVTELSAGPDDRILLRTSAGDVLARSAVVSTGAYPSPHRPPGADTLPPDLPQVGVSDYRNEERLPTGRVLVVGSGQSGCQIAEELVEAGREVVLSCGRAPWIPRRIHDRDFFWWFQESGYLDHPVEGLPSPRSRLDANPQATGHGGGHDLTYRTLRAKGVTLVGRLLGAEDGRVRFADDLGDSVAWGDERFGRLMDEVRKVVAERGLPDLGIPEPPPFDANAPTSLDLSSFGVVVWAGGFRPNYASWVGVSGAFDDLGFPLHVEGASVALPGLYFVGVHFLRTRKSSLLLGVGEDATIVARQVAVRHRAGSSAGG